MVSTSTYGLLVHLVFEKNIDKPYSPSIQQIISATDALAKKLGCKVNSLSMSTKYQVVNDLIHQGLLVCWKKGRKKRVRFSDSLMKYNLQLINECQMQLLHPPEKKVETKEQDDKPVVERTPMYSDKIREVALPITKIVKIGTSSGVIIPKGMMKKHTLKEGDSVRQLLHLKKEVVKI